MRFPSLPFIGLLAFTACSYAALREFSIGVAWEERAPDGVSRPVITVNGQFPGPPFILDEGDDVEFLVCNHLTNGTTVHFHGIEQLHTPWSDGVPGLSQRDIPAGGEFLYKWTATQYGTYWYHAHVQSQISDGLCGPIHIRPNPSRPKPFNQISNSPVAIAAMEAAEYNPRLVLISDWTHETSTNFYQAEYDANMDIFCVNSILFNGKGAVNCQSPQQLMQDIPPPILQLYQHGPLAGQKLTANGCAPPSPFTQHNATIDPSRLPPSILGCEATDAPLEDFPVSSLEQWASFNFVGAQSILAPVVSIDEHPMWLYAVDGLYVEPQLIDGLQLYNGDRFSVMVQLNKSPGSYTMRASNFGLNQVISGFATMTYSGEGSSQKQSSPYFTYGGFPVSPSVTELNLTHIKPFDYETPSQTVDYTHILRINQLDHPWKWTLDGENAYPIDYSEEQPLLYYPDSANATNADFVVRFKNDTWVDFIIINEEAVGPPHPIHKHNNKAYFLGAGVGPWTWSTVAEAAAEQPHMFNLKSPLMKDGYTTPPAVGAPTWLAIRYHVVNPGAWLLHCHIQTHLAGGMAVALLDGYDVLPQIPPEYGVNGNGISGNGLETS